MPKRLERSRAPTRPTPQTPIYRCEAAVTGGLEAIAWKELRAISGPQIRPLTPPATRIDTGSLAFEYSGDLRALLRLKTVLSVFLVKSFAVPRPRALLGDEQFRALSGQIATIRRLFPPDAFQTLYLNAAGSETAVMNRLKDELAQQSGLRVALDDGDLVLRLRRATGGEGWEALIRLSPRPLSARPWRVCNMEGALNATVAHTMALFTRPDPHDTFVNLACGSGSIMIERLSCAPARRVIGCDTSAEALACAQANLAASGHRSPVELHTWDAGTLPLPDRSVDALGADLPFGHLVGSHQANLELYPRIVREAARVAKPGSPFVLITHEVKLMEGLLAASDAWETREVMRIALGGLHPRIFVLRRRA